MTDGTKRGGWARGVAGVLGACAVIASGCGGSSNGTRYSYDVPTSASSPWPMMRRTAANDGRSTVIPPRAAASGEAPWRYPTGKGIFSVPVIGEDGRVLVGSADRTFYAIEPDGRLAWTFPTGEIIDSAGSVAADGTIYFGSGDGHLYALDPDGEQKWAFAAHHQSGGPDASQGNRCSDLPPAGGPSTWFEGNVVIGADGRLWAGNDDYRMYSLDPDGTERFAFFVGPIPFGAV
ncbi:MAG: PQQ-like beta-propeller repeat protein [Deltaproteobacteria bacterium]|nr:PQQ-like beta-propeller repeat protein [Deltaproteobacteria bacterium]